jgi:hypothetical protein
MPLSGTFYILNTASRLGASIREDSSPKLRFRPIKSAPRFIASHVNAKIYPEAFNVSPLTAKQPQRALVSATTWIYVDQESPRVVVKRLKWAHLNIIKGCQRGGVYCAFVILPDRLKYMVKINYFLLSKFYSPTCCWEVYNPPIHCMILYHLLYSSVFLSAPDHTTKLITSLHIFKAALCHYPSQLVLAHTGILYCILWSHNTLTVLYPLRKKYHTIIDLLLASTKYHPLSSSALLLFKPLIKEISVHINRGGFINQMPQYHNRLYCYASLATIVTRPSLTSSSEISVLINPREINQAAIAMKLARRIRFRILHAMK